MNAKVIEKFSRTTLSNDKTRFLLGKCLRKAFDEIKSNAEEAENVLALAWKFQVPQFDEMFQDHQEYDYLPFD